MSDFVTSDLFPQVLLAVCVLGVAASIAGGVLRARDRVFLFSGLAFALSGLSLWLGLIG